LEGLLKDSMQHIQQRAPPCIDNAPGVTIVLPNKSVILLFQLGRRLRVCIGDSAGHDKPSKRENIKLLPYH
jgi:hypothetical protein